MRKKGKLYSIINPIRLKVARKQKYSLIVKYPFIYGKSRLVHLSSRETKLNIAYTSEKTNTSKN